MRPLALFRCDASTEIGGGHVTRCLTLADALSRVGWECEIATLPETLATMPAISTTAHKIHLLPTKKYQEHEAMGVLRHDGYDLFVLDHYQRGLETERVARKLANRILVIDDLPTRQHECDFFLDQNFGRTHEEYRDLLQPGCTKFIGTNFALLRPQFSCRRNEAVAKRNEPRKLERILIALGYTDPLNLTTIALNGILESGLNISVDIILGSTAPHLETIQLLAGEMGRSVNVYIDADNIAELMLAADLAIGAAGSMAWERCCLGLPALVIVGAINQVKINDALGKVNAIKSLGWHCKMDANKIATMIIDFSENEEIRMKMKDAAFSVCDGGGAARVAEILNSSLAQ